MNKILFVDRSQKKINKFTRVFSSNKNQKILTCLEGLGLESLLRSETPDIIFCCDHFLNKEFFENIIPQFCPRASIVALVDVENYQNFYNKNWPVEAIFMNPIQNDILYNFFQKHFLLKKTLEENNKLKRSQSDEGVSTLIGNCPDIKAVGEAIKRLSSSVISILLLGDKGVEFQIFAKTIHDHFDKNSPFSIFDCSLEKDFEFLFQDTRGASFWTSCEGGVLYLKNVEKLSEKSQLEILSRCQFEPNQKDQFLNQVRLVSSSNYEFDQLLSKKDLRKDFVFRLSEVSFKIPPLDKRREDISDFANFFLKENQKDPSFKIKKINPDVLQALEGYSLKGNVDELFAILDKAFAKEKTPYLELSSLPALSYTNNESLKFNAQIWDSNFNLDVFVADVEKQILTQVLKKTKGSKTKAAQTLGVTFRSFRYRFDKYNFSIKMFKKAR